MSLDDGCYCGFLRSMVSRKSYKRQVAKGEKARIKKVKFYFVPILMCFNVVLLNRWGRMPLC